MELQELLERQRRFDAEHGGRRAWSFSEEDFDRVNELLVELFGEIGELANEFKKVSRGDCELHDSKDQISDEVADVFSYMLKLCNIMNIDLQQVYLHKLKRNEERFRRYEMRNKENKEDFVTVMDEELEKLAAHKWTQSEAIADGIVAARERLKCEPSHIQRLRYLLDEWGISVPRDDGDLLDLVISGLLLGEYTYPDRQRTQEGLKPLRESSDQLGVNFNAALLVSARASLLRSQMQKQVS